MGAAPCRLLCCHAPEDDEHRATLERHLAQLQRQNLIALCSVLPGDELRADTQLAQANLVLCLVTSHFLSNDCCHDLLRQARQLQHGRSIRLVPVIVSPCDWEASELGSLQAWPQNYKAVTSWQNQEAAWLDVVQGIRCIVAPRSWMGSSLAVELPATESPSSVPPVSPNTTGPADKGGKVAAGLTFNRLRLTIGAALLLTVTGGGALSFREQPPSNMVRIPLGLLRWEGPSQANRHWIWPFALDRDEVTRGELLRWLETRSGLHDEGSRFRDADGVLLLVLDGAGFTREDRTQLPASGVTHEGAARYCEARGQRLPSYEEWARAARSTPAFEQGPLPCTQVTCGRNGGECGSGGPVAVGSALQDRSAEGVHDLAGSVSEWVQASGGQHFARGGSFARPAASCGSGLAVSLQPGVGYGDVGFRCARDLRW